MTQRILLQDQGALVRGAVSPTGDATGATQRRSFQASVAGAGAVSATVRVYGCNDPRFPVAICDFTLSGTTSATDAQVDDFPWEYYAAEVIAISGTGALVSVFASV